MLVFGLVKGRARTEGSVLAGTDTISHGETKFHFYEKQVINKVLVWFLNLIEKAFYQEEQNYQLSAHSFYWTPTHSSVAQY